MRSGLIAIALTLCGAQWCVAQTLAVGVGAGVAVGDASPTIGPSGTAYNFTIDGWFRRWGFGLRWMAVPGSEDFRTPTVYSDRTAISAEKMRTVAATGRYRLVAKGWQLEMGAGLILGAVFDVIEIPKSGGDRHRLATNMAGPSLDVVGSWRLRGPWVVRLGAYLDTNYERGQTRRSIIAGLGFRR